MRGINVYSFKGETLEMLLGSVTFQTFRLAKGESRERDKVGRVRQL